MSWLSVILWVLTNIPTIIKLVKMLIDLINRIEDKHERRKASRELAAAIQDAKKTGDPKQLRHMLLRLNRRRGVGG